MVDFGKRLRGLRIGRNMTQEALALQLNVTKSVISAYETGIRSPSYDIMLGISEVFSVSTDYLLGRERGKTIDVSGLQEKELQIVANLIQFLKER